MPQMNLYELTEMTSIPRVSYRRFFLTQKGKQYAIYVTSNKDKIIDIDLEDLRYLYQYGEYISDEDYDTVALLQNLTEEEVQNIANVYLEGYQEGCEEAGIDLSEKKAIYIQYQIGTERVVKEVIKGFANLGLQATSCRNAVGVVVREAVKNGFYSRH